MQGLALAAHLGGDQQAQVLEVCFRQQRAVDLGSVGLDHRPDDVANAHQTAFEQRQTALGHARPLSVPLERIERVEQVRRADC